MDDVDGECSEKGPASSRMTFAMDGWNVEWLQGGAICVYRINCRYEMEEKACDWFNSRKSVFWVRLASALIRFCFVLLLLMFCYCCYFIIVIIICLLNDFAFKWSCHTWQLSRWRWWWWLFISDNDLNNDDDGVCYYNLWGCAQVYIWMCLHCQCYLEGVCGCFFVMCQIWWCGRSTWVPLLFW